MTRSPIYLHFGTFNIDFNKAKLFFDVKAIYQAFEEGQSTTHDVGAPPNRRLDKLSPPALDDIAKLCGSFEFGNRHWADADPIAKIRIRCDIRGQGSPCSRIRLYSVTSTSQVSTVEG